MSVKRKVLWTVVHVLGFLVAVVIFYLGLGVGLETGPESPDLEVELR